MKKTIFALCLCTCVLLSGCSGVSREEYDSLASSNSQMESENQALEEKYDSVSGKYNELKGKYDKLSADYETLKKDTEEWRALNADQKAAAKAQAEADRINAEEEQRKAQEAADQAAKEKAEQEEAQRKAEEEARLAEEAKGYETGITFNDISRSPDTYKGKKVKFTGRIIQIVEGSYQNSARMSTSGKYDDVVFFTYYNDSIDVRLLEDDMITIYGTFSGLYTYTTVLNSSVTLPEIHVDRIELIQS